MTDAEKEIFVENLKRQVRNHYTPNVADDICKRLDVAKKEADIMELLYKQLQ